MCSKIWLSQSNDTFKDPRTSPLKRTLTPTLMVVISKGTVAKNDASRRLAARKWPVAGKQPANHPLTPRRCAHRIETYSSYTYRVLKQIHPLMGISNKGMAVMNSFIDDLFERVAHEASVLAAINNRATIGSREVQTAVRLILPGQLAKHAVSEGIKAFANYLDASRM